MRYLRRITFLFALAAVATLLAACSPNGAPKAPASAPAAAAPPSQVATPPSACTGRFDYMGCSFGTAGAIPRLSFGTAPGGGAIFPDVSNWQGHPDWAAAKGHIAGAAYKLGEYVLDVDAAYNASETKRLGIPSIAYWFVEPYSCSLEASRIAADAKQVGATRVVLDEEVTGLSGYAACITADLASTNATVKIAAVYRSSGNDFDDSAASLPCWVAAYGPSSTPTCSSRHVVAFQFTDGKFGFPTFIPGLPLGDVSIDLGLLAPPRPPKPPLVCKAHAKAIPFGCLKYFPDKVIKVRGHHLNEHTVARDFKIGQHTAKVEHRALLLEKRISYVAHHHRTRGDHWAKSAKPDWRFRRGFRRIRLLRDARGH